MVSTLGGRRMSKGKVVTVKAIKAYGEVHTAPLIRSLGNYGVGG